MPRRWSAPAFESPSRESAQIAIANGDTAGACDKLMSFISQVQSQSSKKVATTTANALIADAQRIKSVVGCP